jgi:hypothetical protein
MHVEIGRGRVSECFMIKSQFESRGWVSEGFMLFYVSCKHARLIHKFLNMHVEAELVKVSWYFV